jgi:hypothetical protein
MTIGFRYTKVFVKIRIFEGYKATLPLLPRPGGAKHLAQRFSAGGAFVVVEFGKGTTSVVPIGSHELRL